MHKPVSVFDNETHKIPRNIEVQTDHKILDMKTRKNVYWWKEKNLWTCAFCRYDWS